MVFKSSLTEKNLEKALQGEALAHLKYQFYRSLLGQTSVELGNILDEIIHNEKEHGKIWFKLLNGGEIPDNITNLLDAIKKENEEHIEMYPEFARIAREEGFEDIAELFEGVSEIEGNHKNKFTEILKNIKEDNLFEDEKEQKWKCLNCGHIHYGTKAPLECPICKHPLKYFIRD